MDNFYNIIENNGEKRIFTINFINIPDDELDTYLKKIAEKF
jgi:hypothetical protein